MITAQLNVLLELKTTFQETCRMKNMPWQDIYPLSTWVSIIDRFERRQMETRVQFKKTGPLWKRRYVMPKMLQTLNQQVRHYHTALPKQAVETLESRAALLGMIAGTGQTFLRQNAIPLKRDVDKDKRDANFDYAIAKLVRRARRKSNYVKKLCGFVRNESSIMNSSASGFLQHIKSESAKLDDPDLLVLRQNVMLEKLDPWHRDFEMDYGKVGPKKEQDKSYAQAFADWIQCRPDVPFFVWAEGHYMCTGDLLNLKEDADGKTAADKGLKKGHIQYHQSDDVLAGYVSIVVPGPDGKLRAYDASFTEIVFDTTTTHRPVAGGTNDPNDLEKNFAKHIPANAYVWTKDKLIFVAPHRVGNLHHSSFVSGDAVRCAGMIGTKAGKVTLVDNNSGHYVPETRHLRNFVDFLAANNLFTRDAVVLDESNKVVDNKARNGFKVVEVNWQNFRSNRAPSPPPARQPAGRPGPNPQTNYKCGSCGKVWSTKVFVCTCPMRGPIIPA